MRGRVRSGLVLSDVPQQLLSAQQQAIVRLAAEGLTLAELALRLGTTRGAIKTQIHKIRAKAVAAKQFDDWRPRLTVAIGAGGACRSGAEELRRVLADRGRLRQLWSRSSGVSESASGLADESPEVWRERGRVLRVIAASASHETAVVRVRADEERTGRVAEVMRQGKVLYRTLDDDGGAVYVSISRQLLGALA